MLKKFLSSLYAYDVMVICFAFVLSLLNIIFHEAIPHWKLLIFINVVVSTGIVALAYFDNHKQGRFLRFLHLWYAAPLIFLTFKELYLMIYPIHGRDYDDLFIAVDRWLFGVDPTALLARFAHPVITEILQLAYSSFYFLLIVVAYELYRKGDFQTFLLYVFYIVYGFYLSYIGYFFLPAVGPRFILHNFAALNDELPGLLFTNILRDFVNLGESIPPGVHNPTSYAQRDVFPSGHTMMMLVMMYFAAKHRLKTNLFIQVVGTLLIIGTVYLRYHYVIDLIAGALFMFFCIWTAPKLYERWETVRSSLRS